MAYLLPPCQPAWNAKPKSIGFMSFAPVLPARGPLFGAAARGGQKFAAQPLLLEKDLYGWQPR